MNEQNINPGIFGLGNPNNAYSQYFSGRSWLKMLTVERLVTANVTFEAGCRNNWHVHHKGGQILLVTAGRGWYQAYGEPPRSLKPGDVVNIPPEVKHWHGAAKIRLSPILPLKFRPKARQTNGSNPFQTKTMQSFDE